MPDSVKHLLEVYEVVEQIALVFQVFLYNSTIEDPFYCAPAWSKTCLFFSQQLLSFGLGSVEDNSEQDLAGRAD